MGSSLCKMADIFCLISRIFGAFSSGLLHRTTLIIFKNGFWHVFGIFIFSPKMTMLQKAIAFAWAVSFARLPIFKTTSFLEYLVFF